MTVLVQLWLSSSCAARWGRLNDAKRVDLVATQQRRVANATDPVERTQTYIRISQLLIDLIDSAAHEGDLDAMGPLLDQYAGAIQSARDTIVNSDRDPHGSLRGSPISNSSCESMHAVFRTSAKP